MTQGPGTSWLLVSAASQAPSVLGTPAHSDPGGSGQGLQGDRVATVEDGVNSLAARRETPPPVLPQGAWSPVGAAHARLHGGDKDWRTKSRKSEVATRQDSASVFASVKRTAVFLPLAYEVP